MTTGTNYPSQDGESTLMGNDGEPLHPGMAGMVQASEKAKSASKIDGIPLQVVATGDGQVVLEDPDGVNFTIPQAWIEGHDTEKDFIMDHKKISAAPPGELEKVWRMATASENDRQDPGGFGGNPDYQTKSTLDDYNIRQGGITGEDLDNYWRYGSKGNGGTYGSTKAGVPTTAEQQVATQPQAQTADFYKPSTYRKPPPHPTGPIPADAGTGWGDPGQRWNPRTQRWEGKSDYAR